MSGCSGRALRMRRRALRIFKRAPSCPPGGNRAVDSRHPMVRSQLDLSGYSQAIRIVLSSQRHAEQNAGGDLAAVRTALSEVLYGCGYAKKLLAALAQVEGSGNPVARTYWRWSWKRAPFDLYSPASSAVGMYQITNGTFAEARRYCIRRHTVVKDTDHGTTGNRAGSMAFTPESSPRIPSSSHRRISIAVWPELWSIDRNSRLLSENRHWPH